MLSFYASVAKHVKIFALGKLTNVQGSCQRPLFVQSSLRTLNPHVKPQAKVGPLEIEAEEIVRNTEIYTLSKEAYYRQFGWFMGLCSGLFAYMTHVAYLAFQYKPRALVEQARLAEEGRVKLNTIDKLVHICYDHNYSVALCTALVGAGTFAVGFIFPLRVVRKLTLLRGGKSIEFDTFYPFAFTALRRKLRVPVESVRGVKFGRAKSRLGADTRVVSDQAYSVFKVRRNPFLYYLDRRDGVFVNRLYFDNYIALQRTFK